MAAGNSSSASDEKDCCVPFMGASSAANAPSKTHSLTNIPSVLLSLESQGRRTGIRSVVSTGLISSQCETANLMRCVIYIVQIIPSCAFQLDYIRRIFFVSVLGNVGVVRLIG